MNVLDVEIFQEYQRGHSYQDIAQSHIVSVQEVRDSIGKVMEFLAKLSESNV